MLTKKKLLLISDFFLDDFEEKQIENAFHIDYQGSALDTFYERLTL